MHCKGLLSERTCSFCSRHLNIWNYYEQVCTDKFKSISSVAPLRTYPRHSSVWYTENYTDVYQ